MKTRSILWLVRAATCLASGLVWTASAQKRQVPARRPSSEDRIVLPNGMTVLLYPVEGADRVVVASSFHVGLMNEPKGMAQAAHLTEHLVCRCATKSYGPEE